MNNAKDGAEIYKLPPLDLTKDLDVETAAKYIFSECSQHLKLNFTRYAAEKDESSLMQIRIGMRRTRVAMKAFRFIIHPEVFKNFYRELRYFGNLLGDARDLDVFLRGMMCETCGYDDFREVYGELRQLALAKRDSEYRLNQREIIGGRLEGEIQALDEWRQSDWSVHLGRMGASLLGSPVSAFSLKVIEKGRLNLLSRGAFIDELSLEELHVVRKYVKRSRYHLRFFSSLFNEEKMSIGYDLLVAMQDSLGHVNDVREGLELMSQLGSEVRADRISDTLHLMAAMITTAGEEVEVHLKDFKDLWHQYEDYEITEADFR